MKGLLKIAGGFIALFVFTVWPFTWFLMTGGYGNEGIPLLDIWWVASISPALLISELFGLLIWLSSFYFACKD